jgi:hypothetical protein
VKKVLQHPSASIERLLQHKRYLDFLSKRLLSYLPDEFSHQLSVLGMVNAATNSSTTSKKQVLLVAVNSAAQASKLRFYLPSLKRSLCSEAQFSHIQSIRIKVISNPLSELKNKHQKKNKDHLIFSNHSAQIVESSAQYIIDEGLKSSLLRLSKHIAENTR